MANRLVGNTWIIDTVGLLSTQPVNGAGRFKVLAVGFYAINTTATINIAMSADTTNIVFPLATGVQGTSFNVFQTGGVYLDQLNVITATAGTAYLYLG